MMLKKLICIISGLIMLAGCATTQTKPELEPECNNPGEVVFIINTHESAWIDLGGVSVRRMEIRMCSDDRMLEEFSPPLFGFWWNGFFQLWMGEWMPSKEDPNKGNYRYHNIARFDGRYSKTQAYAQCEEFILEILLKKEKE